MGSLAISKASASSAAQGLQQPIGRPLPPPTVPDGPTLDAPDSIADKDQRGTRANAEPELRPALPAAAFGVAPPVAFRPSPHPRIRWTVASPGGAICASSDFRTPPSRVTKCPTRC